MTGFPRLALGGQLGRLGDAMAAVALVLFVLGSYHSPVLAGLTAFLAILPGLLIAPLAGALLDRRGRIRLVSLDFVLAGLAFGLIGVLATGGRLPVWLLLLIITVSSLTKPLSSTGLRTLYPLMVPRRLWERANAVDSNGYIVAAIFGPALAGVLVAGLGGPVALVATGAFYLAGAVVVSGVGEPVVETHTSGSLLRDSWHGVRHVLIDNPTLRGLAVVLSLANLANGILAIAIPVLVLERLHQGASTVGLLFTTMGIAAFVTVIFVGRLNSEGRERQMILVSLIGTGVAAAILPFASTVPLVFLAAALTGVFTAPFDIALFTLRQRRTAATWIGRAFAVSMALNFAGNPIGSALAGPLLARSLTIALLVAVLLTFVAACLPLWLIPASAPPAAVGRESTAQRSLP